jgi:hypothetical protein
MEPINGFAAEMRRARDKLRMTQDRLSALSNYSVSMIQKVESGREPASPEFIAAVWPHLMPGVDVEGLGTRLWGYSARGAPDWVAEYLEAEASATRIWCFEVLVMPGLLQTEAYARTLLGGDEGLLASRLGRQDILRRDRPPNFVVLLHELALRTRIGSPAVMIDQLEHLLTMAERFVIQAIPSDSGSVLPFGGPFAIATVDGRDLAYANVPTRGVSFPKTEVVSGLRDRWEILRGEALSRRQSEALIREVIKEWQSETWSGANPAGPMTPAATA